MPETRTDVVLGFKTKGREQTQREAGKLSETVNKILEDQTKGFRDQARAHKEVQREVKGLEGELQSLVRRQLRTNDALAGVEKGTAKYKALKKSLTEVNEEAKRVRDQIGLLERAIAKPERGAFTQGLLQGGIPGAALIQRGPGMFRQAAGAAVGRGAQRMFAGAKGAAGAPFSGLSGLQTAAAGLPVVGGAIASQLGQAMNLAERGMGMRQLESRFAAAFGIASESAERSAAINRAGMQAVQQATERATRNISPTDIRERAVEIGTRGDKTYDSRFNSAFLREARKELEKEALEGSNLTRIRSDAEEKAARDFRRGPMSQIRGRGEQFGLKDEETLQIIGQVARAGGGASAQALAGADTFLAAERLGIGPEISGAFAGGAMRGGLRGGADAGQRLEDSFQKAIARGLTETEAIGYLQEVASGISEWRTTGIPFNEQGLEALQKGTRAIGAVRSGVVAGQLSQGIRGVAQGGIQSALDLQVLQKVADFKGGGPEAFVDALQKLENLENLSPEKFNTLVRTFAGRATGGFERLAIQEGFRKLGATVGIQEAGLLQAEAFGDTSGLSDADKALAKRVNRRVRTGEGTLKARGGIAVSDEEKRQADIDNRLTQTGESMLKAAQDLQDATTLASNALAVGFKGSVELLTSTINTVSENFTKLIETMSGSAGFDL